MNDSAAKNTFSPTWFATFLDPIPAEHTEREIAFVAKHFPLASFPRLIDLCCGSGRHAIPLAALGYDVLAIDADAGALARAAEATPRGASVRYVRANMRDLANMSETVDGVLNMWHSFGFDDDEGNRALLAGVCARLRPGGRCLIDVYNRAHFVTLPLREESDRGGHRIHTTRAWTGNRVRVTLRYDNGDTGDAFEWRLYDPDEFTALAREAGLTVVQSCAWFTDTLPASAEHGRMQVLLERA